MKSFLKLLPFIKPQWRLILVSLALSLPMSAISSSPAILIQYFLDKVLVNKPQDPSVLLLFSAAIVGIYALNLVVRFTFNFTARLANERVMRSIREKLFSHFVGLSTSFFTEASVGDLMSRVMSDVFYVSHGIVSITSGSRQFFTFVGMFSYAIYLNAKLMLITLSIAPILIWVSRRSSILVKGYSSKIQEANGGVFSVMQEVFSGFKIVKAFALEKFAFDRFKARNDTYVHYALKSAKIEEIVSPTVEIAGALAISVVIYVGGRDVISGHVTPGQLGAFFASFALMINPIRTLNENMMKLNLAAAAADRIDDALAIKSSIEEPAHPKECRGLQKEIQFNNVSFSYEKGGREIFSNVAFTVQKGKTTAIVGASGQGKSTLVNLLPRFYDSSKGSVLIDGVDVREFSLKSLRSQIAVVSQDVFLFNDTVFNNIAAGRVDGQVTKEEVIAAAKAANALDFIEKLPEGFQSVIGERGQKLSGGERQRLSIARAIIKNSPILILDEATSSLDTQSEKAVQVALEHLMIGKTTLVIAHRLSTIKNSDEILVMEGGSIVERGRHAELMNSSGVYSKFHL